MWGATNGVQKNTGTNIFMLNLLAYAKLTTAKAIVKVHTTYGQNYSQYVGLGGIAEYRDAITGGWKYVAQNQLNMWGELIATSSKKFQPAIFIGYLQNLGLSNPINKSDVLGTSLTFLGRGINTARTFDNMFRVSPRVDIYSGKMKIALEYELSIMRWADTDGSMPNTTNTSFKAATGDLARTFDAVNNRVSAVMVYNF
jgi:hypothetical protein